MELGAGGGLPGIVAAQNGASKVGDRSSSPVLGSRLTRVQVVLTDYPDAALIENLACNVQQNVREEQRSKVTTQVTSP